MTKLTTKPDSKQPATEMAVDLFDNLFDRIETEVRARASSIEELICGELIRAGRRVTNEETSPAMKQEPASGPPHVAGRAADGPSGRSRSRCRGPG